MAILGALGLVAIMILASLLANDIGPARPGAAAPASATVSPRGTADQMLVEASLSLATGAGPANGAPLACSGLGGSRSCTLATLPAFASVLPTGWGRVPTDVPSARLSPGSAYDVKDGYTVLFGGTTYPAYFADTWTYVGGYWTNITSGTHPAARADVGMVYDAADKYVLLFGGFNGSAALSDTWTFSAGHWTQLHPAVHPGPRAYPSMSYDTTDHEVVLFGGITPALKPFGDTWTYKAGTWTNLTHVLALAPSPRGASGFATDGATAGAVLFGGSNGTVSIGGTWIFHNKSWSAVHPASSPGPRLGAAMSYDTSAGTVVLFGGENQTQNLATSDTWTFSGGNWTKVVSTFHPSSRWGAAVSDGASGSGLVVFGGAGNFAGFLNDTWEFKGGIWEKAIPPVPIARLGTTMTYDEADGYVVLFGGADSHDDLFHDTWTFAGGAWKQLHPKVFPPGRFDASMTYDQADGYVVLFGGTDKVGLLNDTWTFSAGAWTEAPSSVAPPARFGASMSYDAADGYVLLFGGDAAGDVGLADTWTFSGGAWALQDILGPPARAGAAMTYDSEDGFVLLFGGENDLLNTVLNDTWTYLAGTWTNLSASLTTAPSPRSGSGMADDTYDGYVVLFGGTGPTARLGDTWTFTNDVWTNVTSTISRAPSPREPISGMTFDTSDSAVLLFGGLGAGFATMGDTWEYD